jgi:putative endonuclease
VKLVYGDEYGRIGHAYSREKQAQGWSRVKREPLIHGDFEQLRELARKHFRGKRLE